jgi:hypothetical protein
MTTEEKAKAYDKALEEANKELKTCGSLDCDAARLIFRLFPPFVESEDERIRKEISTLYADIDSCISELLAARTNKDAEAEGKALFRMEGLMVATLQDLSCVEDWLEKQREPHYNKRNALFDKCVENCDPKTVEEVNKRVDDIMNMPELSAFEQALTNFIGDWEDDEERWPSNFVKKHGRHILDMAREELQKEQKPAENPFDANETMKMKDRIDEGFTKMMMQEQKPVEPSYDELQRHQDELYDFKVFAAKQAREHHISFVHDFEWNNFCAEILSYFNEQKPAEWSEKDETSIAVKNPEAYKIGFADGEAYAKEQADWSEEDDVMLDKVCCLINPGTKLTDDNADYCVELKQWIFSLRERILKSLKPSWKPSEEQMDRLFSIIAALRKDYCDDMADFLASIYEQLKKLM